MTWNNDVSTGSSRSVTSLLPWVSRICCHGARVTQWWARIMRAWVTEHKFYFSRVRGDIETGLAFPGCIISQTLVHARPYRKEKKSSWPKVGTVNGHRVRWKTAEPISWTPDSEPSALFHKPPLHPTHVMLEYHLITNLSEYSQRMPSSIYWDTSRGDHGYNLNIMNSGDIYGQSLSFAFSINFLCRGRDTIIKCQRSLQSNK